MVGTFHRVLPRTYGPGLSENNIRRGPFPFPEIVRNASINTDQTCTRAVRFMSDPLRTPSRSSKGFFSDRVLTLNLRTRNL